jgi:hypothetical protein
MRQLTLRGQAAVPDIADFRLKISDSRSRVAAFSKQVLPSAKDHQPSAVFADD